MNAAAGKYVLWIFWDADARARQRLFAPLPLLEERLRRAGGIEAALWHVPETVADPCLGHASPRQAVLQLHFGSLQAMRRCLEAGSSLWHALQHWAAGDWPGGVSIQAMEMSMQSGSPPAGPSCAYVVGYEGQGGGREWARRYHSEHVDLMRRLPGIRQVEVHVRAPCPVGWPVPVRPWLLRNRAVFDDAAAMQAALESPARLAMRQHRHAMPPLGGANEHIAMRACPLRLS
jgi:hypothetical protein